MAEGVPRWPTATEALRVGTALLHSAGQPSPAADARILLAHAMGLDLAQLFTAPTPDGRQSAAYLDALRQRADGLPLQHITGEAWFRTVRVEVGPGVFVPRPETEVMTGLAIDRVRELQAAGHVPVVVELCAGSGAISLAIATEAPGCRQIAVELSEPAYAFAARNLTGTNVDLVLGDMADALPELDGEVDVVICNPPYVPLDAYLGVTEEVRRHEPPLALFSGPDGLDALRVLADSGARLLKPGGWLAAEHAEVQAESAPRVFLDHGEWTEIRGHKDLTGRPRFVTARRR
ncbi:MAG TPA: peptide chain release factor N(5)-glutamine methyltransferase [Propionibacterium sp.]|jgi:release factor glutamine methyltransferase|nr:peptide chain release factor N(5)-glutamine methyltransferase [Propionibacterium sp.]